MGNRDPGRNSHGEDQPRHNGADAQCLCGSDRNFVSEEVMAIFGVMA
jgi:hypothetical protein